MSRPIPLRMPMKAYRSLWEKANGRAKNVTVDRKALFDLLADHGQVLNHVEYSNPEERSKSQ